LFMRPYKRLQIDSTEYLCWCLWYIHHNPTHHNYTKDWMNWTYSSYKAYISNHPTVINKTFLIELFGGLEEFINYHKMQSCETKYEIFLET
jgi:putative transposase